MANISINKENYRIIKRKYNKALKESKESFFYEGNELLTSYAKYLLQYIEMVLKITPKKTNET